MYKRLNNALKRSLIWWSGFTCKCAGRVLIMSLLLTGGSLYYTAGHLGFNTSTNDMLSADLPFRQTYHVFENAFPQYLNNILVVIDGKTPETARDAAKRLAKRLRKQPELFKSVYLPRANPFLEEHALLFLKQDKLEQMSEDLAEIQPFLGKLTHDPSLRGLFSMLASAVDAVKDGDKVEITPILIQIREALQANIEQRRYRLSWEEMMQDEGKVSDQRQQFILIQPHMNFSKLLAAKPAMQAIRTATNDLHLDAEHGLKVRLTGSVPLAHDELISVSHGAKIAGTLALLLVGIVLTVGLGSFRLVAATLICLLVGLSLTTAFAALAIGHLNLISVAFAVLYIGLGVDYAIHLSLRYRELEDKGMAPETALRQSAQDVGGSLVLCAITTAVGFYCFVPTAYTGISELGIISGTGMFISLIVTLTLLPSILCLWPAKNHGRPTTVSTGDATAGWLYTFDHWLEHSGRSVLILTLLLGVGATWLSSQVSFDYNPINLRDQQSESVIAYKDLIARHTISPSSIMVMTRNANNAHEMEQYIGKLQSVDKAISIFDFVPQGQNDKLDMIDDMALILGPDMSGKPDMPPTVSEQIAAMRKLDRSLAEYLHTTSSGNVDAFRALHETLSTFLGKVEAEEPAAQSATLSKLKISLLTTLPTTLDFLHTALQTQVVTESGIPESLRRRWVSPNGTYRIEVTPKKDISDIHALRRFVAQVRTIAPNATGAPVFTLEAGNAVIHAFRQASITALILITLLLILLLRNVKDVLLVLLPLMLAGVLTGATAVLLGIPLNFANVIALPLLLGIGVDSGIHMVRRFRFMQMKGSTDHHLLATSTSKAVILSALTTICGFGNLSFSAHQGTASMGQLLTLGISFTLICTLFVLPVFLNHFAAKAQKVDV
ncbi:MAG: efflux RND transporter permease subunit [Mariprofundaceae bacterium]|nr:efflux RND transporter permease subunit [Mariprofundaceae bacterium]